MTIVKIPERVANERKLREQSNLMAAGSINACAWHLTMVSIYLNETGRVDLAEALCATATAINSIARLLRPTQGREDSQPLHPRDIG